MSDQPAKPRRRWLMPLLFTSLAINLLIIGLIVGWALSGGRDQRAQGPIRGVLGEPFVRALPQESRRAMVEEITQQRGRFRENREELRQRFDAFLDVLAAEPFDADAAKSLLQDQRRVGIERQEFGEDLLLKQLSSMTVSERIIYGERLQKALRRVRRR